MSRGKEVRARVNFKKDRADLLSYCVNLTERPVVKVVAGLTPPHTAQKDKTPTTMLELYTHLPSMVVSANIREVSVETPKPKQACSMHPCVLAHRTPERRREVEREGERNVLVPSSCPSSGR